MALLGKRVWLQRIGANASSPHLQGPRAEGRRQRAVQAWRVDEGHQDVSPRAHVRAWRRWKERRASGHVGCPTSKEPSNRRPETRFEKVDSFIIQQPSR